MAQIAVALALAIAGCDDRDVYLGSDVHPHQPASGSGGHDAGSGGMGGGAAGNSGHGGHGGTTSDAGTGLGMGSGGRADGTGGTTIDPIPMPDSGTGGFQDAGNTPSSCPTGFDDCDGRADNGCETNIDSDNDHCGDCDTMCPRFGIMSFGSTCSAGVCVLNCEQPFANCDGNPDNGCENFGACP